jgi:hypothetical protein
LLNYHLALALGLGIMFSEVGILLYYWFLCAPSVVLRDPLRLVRPHTLCRKWVNHGVLARNTIVDMIRSGLGEGPVESHLCMGKAHRLHGVTRLVKASCLVLVIETTSGLIFC